MSRATAWRLLIDRPRRGAWNMAVDEMLLEGVSRGRIPPTLRFYQWAPPCLSLGYFQSFSAVDVDACRRARVEIVRRPTGGRAILHHRELTYSIALPLTVLEPESGVLQSYYRLSLGLTDGLRRLGVETSLAPSSPLREAAHGPACFDEPSDHEILLSGRKLVGSAQVRRNGSLLQHGSVLFQPQVNELLACLRMEPADRERQRAAMATGVAGLDQAGRFTPRAVAEALAAGLGGAFGVALEPGSLSRREKAEAAELERDRYRTAAWTERPLVSA
jgi:lipoyl(octanoyl) transferase